ncbi:UDP-glucose 4-epimerase [termite gut metagenome]|uniref:UDP-glucose 4-epimerase n=1 Tax=termite gut metagenome TaxID=433724 RepID=A0A5J4RK80_9ZZZZ
MAASILITGASGFIGSFMVEEALKRKLSVWAGIRSTSSKKYLNNPDIYFFEADFADASALQTCLLRHKESYGKFDYIIHCAGATKCVDKDDFEKINYLQTKHLVDALIELDMLPMQFVFLSSLSVFGPVHEQDYVPIRENDTPIPNTLYGISKLKAERYMQSLPSFPYVSYRPTGVYGPRDKDYFLLAQSVKSHIDFSAGYKRQDITFIYVKDLVKAVFMGMDKHVFRRAYFISDGEVYRSRRFSELLQKELGVSFVIQIRCPLGVLKIISWLAALGARLFKRSSTLNPDKYKILKQRNWRCDVTPARQELGFTPDYNLERGVKETVAWYKEAGWISSCV